MHSCDLSQETQEVSSKLGKHLLKEIQDSNVIKKMFDDMYEKFQSIIHEYVEIDEEYNYKNTITREVTHIINSLLIGDEKVINSLMLNTEYTFDGLQEVRIKIWETCASEIEGSIIKIQKKEIEILREKIKNLERHPY